MKFSFLDFPALNAHIWLRMIKNFNFNASDGENLKVTTYIEHACFSGNSIIFVHGFKGFKDWGFVPYVGEYFAKRGFFVLTFNFSHNGIGDNLTEFTELEKFAENSFSREIRELNEIINALKENSFEDKVSGKIGIIGHSRGGAISLLSTVERKDVHAVALWASISKLDRYSKRQKEEWRKKGSFEVMNMRTKQIMRLNVSLLEDIEKIGMDSIKNTVRNLDKPLLIAHGDQDLAVPIKEAEEIYSWSDKEKTEFYKIYSTGHTFDIVHPFAGTTDKFEKLLDKTSNFFINNFK